MFLFSGLVFLAIPIIIITLFIIGVVGYIFTKNEGRNYPERNLENKLSVYRTIMILSGVCVALFAVVAIGFYVLVMQAVSFM